MTKKVLFTVLLFFQSFIAFAAEHPSLSPSEFLARFSPEEKKKVAEVLTTRVLEALGESVTGRRAEAIAIGIRETLSGVSPEGRSLLLKLDEIQAIQVGLDAYSRSRPLSPSAGRAVPLSIDDLDADLRAASAPRIQPQPVSFSNRIQAGHFSNESMSDLEVSQSIRFAEILQALSSQNGSSVSLAGRTVTQVRELIEVLLENGHQIEATEERTTANFLNFTLDGEFDLRWPLWIDTGLKVQGTPVVIPAGHSQWIWNITGPWGHARIAFFRGLDGVGYFPRVDQRPAWTGLRTRVIEGSVLETFRAAEAYAALHRIEVQVLARGYPFQGYGLLGTCNDSVAALNAWMGSGRLVFPLVRSPSTNLASVMTAQEIAALPGDVQWMMERIQDLPADVPSITRPIETIFGRILDMNPFPGQPEKLLDQQLAQLYRLISEHI